MEEIQGSGKANLGVGDSPAVSSSKDVGSSSNLPPAPAPAPGDGTPEGGWKKKEPESLRLLTEAMEGWKNKQEEINKKFMESFENLGKDLSQMQHDTVTFKSSIDQVKTGIERRASADKIQRLKPTVLTATSKSFKDVSNSKDLQQ
ncbi:hypothetical protein MPTK1_2g05590 [Marchantia polymorpha subsp. ruderalis]|nr:hypothetical protein MARPO_0021s0015 [Marchantia polymorpha]BBN01209.1 hypothetical protein Mp_2g05590 [Marchantia polymorpha subsp. ruderalis]|eukprot:PTQ44133.1 hypothetical protein MARPO_0021s0015 [Marchantia polymorpha]